MTTAEATSLIQKGVPTNATTWADVGAGTGTFTLALQEILSEGVIYAVDKSPHALWRLPLNAPVKIQVVEGDFFQKMDFPKVDGLLMANALHYAPDPVSVLKNILGHLKPGGVFILVEYETHTALPPWIPFPIPFDKFKKIAQECGLSEPVEIGRMDSQYGHQHIYTTKSIFKIPTA
jgi:SAM-dependent methyltransferase